MKRNLIILLTAGILAFLASPLSAQSKYEESIKYWEDGPLTLADFSRRTVPASNGVISDLWYGWETVSDRNKIGNLIYMTPRVRTFMDKLNSWVVISEFDKQQQLYLQTTFDMAEMVGRQYQKDLFTAEEPYKVQEFYRRTLSSSVDSFQQESRYGRDSSVVAYYAAKIQEQLAEEPEAPEPPKMIQFKTGLALGVFMGYTCNYLLTGLSERNGPLHFFNFGFDIPFSQRIFLTWDMGLTSLYNLDCTGISKNGYDWLNGQSTEAASITFDLGYRVIDKPYFAIEPFIGAGVLGVSQTLPRDMWNNGEPVSSSLNGLRVESGLTCDYKIRRHYFPMENSYDEIILRFKLYGAYSNMPAVLGPTWSINMGIAFGYDGWITSWRK